jgi:hypothetical protein
MILWVDPQVACRKIGPTIMSIFRCRVLVQNTGQLEHLSNIERKNHAISIGNGGTLGACLVHRTLPTTMIASQRYD